MKILNIGIPTYKRTQNAKRALEGFMSICTDKINLTLSSNEPNHELEKFCNSIENCKFNSFSENRGAIKNFNFLLKDSKDIFKMLVSDEDSLFDKEAFERFLEWLYVLQQKRVNSSFIIVGIKNLPNRKTLLKKFKKGLNINDVIFLGIPVSTYITGFCMHSCVEDILIDNALLEGDSDNAYPHLSLFLVELSTNKSKLAIPYLGNDFLQMNPSAGIGGDAFVTNSNNLNPSIYGLNARINQLVYMINLSTKLNLGPFVRLVYILNTIKSFLPHLRKEDSLQEDKKYRHPRPIKQIISSLGKNEKFSKNLKPLTQFFIKLIIALNLDVLITLLSKIIRHMYILTLRFI